MTTTEKIEKIEKAVKEGKTLYTENHYKIVQGTNGELLIKSQNGHCIGLFWTDENGTHLNCTAVYEYHRGCFRNIL